MKLNICKIIKRFYPNCRVTDWISEMDTESHIQRPNQMQWSNWIFNMQNPPAITLFLWLLGLQATPIALGSLAEQVSVKVIVFKKLVFIALKSIRFSWCFLKYRMNLISRLLRPIYKMTFWYALKVKIPLVFKRMGK